MTKSSRISAENDPDQKIIFTAGKVFEDGSALELVLPATSDEPSLLLWAGGEVRGLGRQIEHDGKTYAPVNADASIWKAMTLPTEVADRGLSANLFCETVDLVQRYAGLPTAESAVYTAWNATNWFADLLHNPQALFLHGPDMGLAIRLFQVSSCISRHPLIVTEIERATLRSLMLVRPTFLINQEQMSPRLRAFCCASNYRGLVLPGRRGEVFDVVSSKAIFVGTAARALNNPGIHLYLPPALNGLKPLDLATQLQIKKRFQPWYLSHRLSNLEVVRQSTAASSVISTHMDELAQTLRSCTLNGAQLEREWAPLLRSQELDSAAQQCLDPDSAMIEILWTSLHSCEKPMSMKLLAEDTNILLEARGEIRKYSLEELGKILERIGVLRLRRSSGMFVVFDRETSRSVHQWARRFGLGTRVASCPDCTEVQIAAK